ncbi:MAG: hypothetical protein ACYTHK_10825 [Planctomycetota bacterium]|jgi:tetratricopeptide (TPR) repeat protein
MRRTLLGLLIVLAPVSAQQKSHVEVAKRFLRAFDNQDSGTMAILAAQPAVEVPYALVVFSLLEGKEYDAARQLVHLRSAAPEGEGLKRLCEGYINRARASNEQRIAWQKAETLLRQKRPNDALAALKAGGPPLDGTITGARIEWTRARARALLEKWDLAVASFAECARIARTTGWLQRAVEAEKHRFLLARARPSLLPSAIAAADALVKDTRDIDDRLGELNARVGRAALLLAQGEAEKARADYAVSVDRARALRMPELEGKLLSNIGYILHAVEGQPRRARRYYAQALATFLSTKDPASIAQARFNMARVLTDTAEYTEALAQLAEAGHIEGAPDSLRRPIRAQRAYILRRQGRLDRSRDAYLALLESASTDAEKASLSLELGELQLLRGDFVRARARFEAGGSDVRALAGAAAAWGGLQREKECRENFAAAVEAVTDPMAKGRLNLQWAAFERAFGAIDRAVELADTARSQLAREDSRDYGNAAATWVVLGDLYLLDGRMTHALDALAKASVFLVKLRDPGRAIPALVRETLVQLSLGTRESLEEATQRRGTLQHVAEGISDPGLKSMAACADAVVEIRRGHADEATARFEEALRLAIEAASAEKEANALATRALHAGADGLSLAMRAIEAMAREPDRSRVVHPLVVGERPDDAASIALRCLMETKDPDPARAFELAERIKAGRLQLALRGRDAILIRRLSEGDYRRYVDARSRLRQARTEKEGAPEARQAFVDLADELARQAPFAFPRAPGLRAVQGALRADELLLLFVDDPYLRVRIAVDKTRVVVQNYDAGKQTAGLEDLLKDKRRLLVAPDGFFALAPTPGVAIRYVASAAAVLAQRGRPEKDPASLRRIERPVRIDLRHPQATDAWPRANETGRVVVLDRTDVVAGKGASVDGYLAAALPRILGGADTVVVSLSGKSDPRLVERFLAHMRDDGADPEQALRLTQRWAQGVDGLKEPAQWGSLVLWGAP